MADGDFELKPIPINGEYNVQRFRQYSPEDAANWYVVQTQNTKSETAMYPTLGRRHISNGGTNVLIFSAEPRFIYRSINYWYAIVGDSILRIDRNFTVVDITGTSIIESAGNIFFSYLTVNLTTFACFVDAQHIFIYQEDFGSLRKVTDPNAPGNITINGVTGKPGYIATFGNRLVVSVKDTPTFYLSAVNLGGLPFNPNTCFTTNSKAVFAQEAGIIQQLGVLHNTLYIFCKFSTGIWANIPSTILTEAAVNQFPWKKNTTYDWNFGMADPLSLDIDFGRMVFLAQNRNGLLQVMASDGGNPVRISSKAIDVLFQRYSNMFPSGGPFLSNNSNGFLYQYENTIFYRLSAGKYMDYGLLDLENSANSIEFNFETKTWHRCIEANGERNRVQQHLFINNMHLVTVSGDSTVYQFSGNFYDNEIRNPAQSDSQELDAYLKLPFRYERVTPIIAEIDQGEFETAFVQIDMVFGESNITLSTSPFANTVFIITEDSDPTDPTFVIDEDQVGGDKFLITENSNTPDLNALYYNSVYKPHIELYFSDNGGITFDPADVLEFSQMGVYEWRMRWYQMGSSRNRVYKLIAVSPVPIVILSGWTTTRRMGPYGN